MQKNLSQPLLCILLSFVTAIAGAQVEVSMDPETQLTSWKFSEQHFSLELIQRLPDQTRAFFQARGFSSEIANDIATQCVLQAIGKNTSDKDQLAEVSYHLKNWKIYLGKKAQGIKLKEQWDDEWTDDQVNNASRIAFRWATFPTQQSFDPGGDFNWGMISFGLPPGSIFDLEIEWRQDNHLHSQWIKQIQCPVDR